MTDPAELARELESVVRSVPGVTAVYPASPVIVTVVAAVVSAVVSTVTSTVSAVSAVVGAGGDAPTERATTPALVAVTTGKAGLKVAASIGVASADSSTEVCRHVHDAIAASAGMADVAAIDSITVTVASID